MASKKSSLLVYLGTFLSVTALSTFGFDISTPPWSNNGGSWGSSAFEHMVQSRNIDHRFGQSRDVSVAYLSIRKIR